MPKWRNGRRGGLKIRCPQGRVSSILTFGTTTGCLTARGGGCRRARVARHREARGTRPIASSRRASTARRWSSCATSVTSAEDCPNGRSAPRPAKRSAFPRQLRSRGMARRDAQRRLLPGGVRCRLGAGTGGSAPTWRSSPLNAASRCGTTRASARSVRPPARSTHEPSGRLSRTTAPTWSCRATTTTTSVSPR